MGIGIGITLAFVVISLIIAWQSKSHRLGQAVYFLFVGLALAAAFPGTAQATHTFITDFSNSVINGDFSK